MVKQWNERAKRELQGRTIVHAEYMTGLGFDCPALVLMLDNGAILIPSRDDEGNGPGAILTTGTATPVFPALG